MLYANAKPILSAKDIFTVLRNCLVTFVWQQWNLYIKDTCNLFFPHMFMSLSINVVGHIFGEDRQWMGKDRRGNQWICKREWLKVLTMQSELKLFLSTLLFWGCVFTRKYKDSKQIYNNVAPQCTRSRL